MNRKIIRLGLFCCLGMSVLTGCEQKSVDYGLGGNMENIQAGGTTKNSVAQFAGASKWTETLRAVYKSGDTLNLNIDAEVSVPESEQMYVIEVKEPDFEPAYKKKVAERIYDSDAIYYHDYAHYVKQELEKIRTYYQGQCDHYAQYPGSELGEEYRGLLEECEAALETAEDNYTPVEEYTLDEYIGERDGILYELTFWDTEVEREEWKWGGRMKQFSLTAKSRADFMSKECQEQLIKWKEERGMIPFVEMELWEIVPYSEGSIKTGWYEGKENLCQVSKEEAQEKAELFVGELGLDYAVCSHSAPINWGGPLHSGGFLYGYVFTFDFGVDGVSFVDFGAEHHYRNYDRGDTAEKEYSLEAVMKVFVTDRGVMQVDAYNPIEMTGMSGPVALLSLDDIKGIMAGELTDHVGQFGFSYTRPGEELSFDEMKLIYFRVRDKENEGHYSYIPTWRLSESADMEALRDENAVNPKMIANVVLFNAIDGTVIDLNDEL